MPYEAIRYEEAIELVGVFASADFVFDDNGEPVHVINDENVNMMPFAKNGCLGQVKASKGDGLGDIRCQKQLSKKCGFQAMTLIQVYQEGKEIRVTPLLPNNTHRLE